MRLHCIDLIIVSVITIILQVLGIRGKPAYLDSVPPYVSNVVLLQWTKLPEPVASTVIALIVTYILHWGHIL